jgi:hypothetical protein
MQFILRFVSVHFEMGGSIIIEKRLLWYNWFFDPSRYSWNIVESGDKHQTIDSSVFTLRWEICYCSNNSWYMYVYIYVSPPLFATPLKLLNRISWNLVGSKDTICSCAYYQEFWSPEFCGSYAPLNLEISRNLLLKQLVSATPLKLRNRISWNLVGSKDTICSCAYYQEILIP